MYRSRQSLINNRRPKTARKRNKTKPISCTIVGDHKVGKSWMTLAFTQHCFPKCSKYTETFLEPLDGNIAVSERQYTINVFDTSGDHLQKPTRELCYRSSEVIVIVFSVVKRSSFENVRDFWLPEIKRSLGRNKKPIVLVGCQTDLRHYGSKRYRDIVKTEEAKHVAAKCGLDFYMECSTALLVGVRDVFENIAWSALKNRSKGFYILRRLSKLCCCTCMHSNIKRNAKL